MTYTIRKIKTKDEITSCEKFLVNHYQWVKGPTPVTYGYAGYLEGQGLYVKMTCEEADPRRVAQEPEGRSCKEKGKRVCDDSSMEIFLGFPEEDGSISDNSLYVNFEINPNGVMYAAYGFGRKDRKFISDEVYAKAAPETVLEKEAWSLEVLFPETFLEEISKKKSGESGTMLYCNFYKISETPEIEHYGSWNPINSDTPNFHLPSSFGQAVVQ